MDKSKKTVVLFPKGETLVLGIFSIDFLDIIKSTNAVIGRYPIKAIEEDLFEDLRPRFNKAILKEMKLIPGIKSAFIKDKSGNIEFAVSVDYKKAFSYFKAFQELNTKGESILSMDQIKMLMRLQLQKEGIV